MYGVDGSTDEYIALQYVSLLNTYTYLMTVLCSNAMISYVEKPCLPYTKMVLQQLYDMICRESVSVYSYIMTAQ